MPASALGKQGRCPSCKHVFPLERGERAVEAHVIEPPPPPPTSIWDEASNADYTLAPLPPQPANPEINPYAPSAVAHQVDRGRYNHGFGWEHRGRDAGMTGGLAMMAIAAVWFFGGLAFGLIFYYPPILFVIGLVGFIRGLFTGNVSGR